MKNENNVQVNQIWEDWDIRFRNSTPRLIKVIDIKNNIATCRNISTSKITKIRLDRFKPNSTGYRLCGISVGNIKNYFE